MATDSPDPTRGIYTDATIRIIVIIITIVMFVCHLIWCKRIICNCTVWFQIEGGGGGGIQRQ